MKSLNRLFRLCIFLAAAAIVPLPARANHTYIHHDIAVSLNPAKHSLTVTDAIAVPADVKSLQFALHAGMHPSSPDRNVVIRKIDDQGGFVPVELFNVTLPPGERSFTLQYSGSIDHPAEAGGMMQARAFDQTAGSISNDMIYLAGSSAWSPRFETDFVTFVLTAEMPARWDCVSQGNRSWLKKGASSVRIRWDSPDPQEEIYLIASRFTRYEMKSGTLSAMVFLRTPDKDLAGKYLEATVRYIDLYSKLIGPYPYSKFALVENFTETGLGMPSFTLLGPTVIRLPFIITSSYPHEILHNWWGNSVYPVYEKGNWSEGITAYLADHLMQEQTGMGADYRLAALQKYADYVQAGKDFPLTQFTSRHSPATEAVGYGKALMFFHMLRLELGDTMFVAGLRDFYRKNKFRFAAFDDIEKSFEAASGKNLKPEFNEWITRTGAPRLRLVGAKAEQRGAGYLVTARLEQVQPGEAYQIRIPVAVTVEGRERAIQSVADMSGKKYDLSLEVPSRPLRLDIDPEFDVFRRLDRDEIPPAISQALGAKKMLVILPAAAGKELLEAYEQFAKALAKSGPDDVEVRRDDKLTGLPADRAVTILGWENRFLEQQLPAWNAYDVAFAAGAIRIGKTEIARERHAVVLTARTAGNKDQALLFIAADRASSLPGLARKLPHYHKYSYLAFEGDEPANIAKGRWPVVDSPLTAFLPDRDGNTARVAMAGLSPRAALASPPSEYSAERMMDTVRFLAGPGLKGREIGTPEIDKAAAYLAEKFREAGLRPAGDAGSYFRTWKERERNITLKNVVAVIPGKKKEWAGQSVVIGAHYDHLGLGGSLGRIEDRGMIHPGADDNASGVAVLLELAKTLGARLHPGRSIVFIAFSGEEEGKLGSRQYVEREKQHPVSRCLAMVNLDTVGRLGNNKLLVLGAGSANEWIPIFKGAGFVTGVDIATVSEELDSSDQKSFQEAGVPAVQLFSGPNPDYHRPGDTAEKIDADGLVKVASVASEVIEYLAGREEPLTSTLKQGAPSHASPKQERKVSLGTVPDYAYNGTGVRLSGTVPGSPAEAAGLREGDVIIEINARTMGGLRDLSDLLKVLKPGDRVSIVFLRNGEQVRVETAVTAR